MCLEKMISLLVILLFSSIYVQFSYCLQCDDYFEFSCSYAKFCIDKQEWCDGIKDCTDGSDEYFCDGNVECIQGQFRCSNGRCIPISGKCDGIDHCTDRSDEEGCTGNKLGSFKAKVLTVAPIKAPYENMPVSVQRSYESNIKQAVASAASYLLDQRQADYGWGSPVATSRAIVALTFAERIQPLLESEKELMKKQLNIQLSLDLLQSPMETSLSHLALYINALYATCQDPRSFQGLDLVKRLRTETERAMSSDFSVPIVFLTLCVAGESDPGDNRIMQLRNIYASSHDRISTQALALRAWDCMAKRDLRLFREYTRYLDEFSSKIVNITDGNLDVYSTALYLQAYNAAVVKSNVSILMSHRQEDGSFGDLLSTYYAIPALLNATLLELSCHSTVTQEALTANTFNMYSGGKKVTYSLWIPTDAYENTRTVTVNFGEKATFYDIMRMAEWKDPSFRFMYDIKDGKRKIYSIADTPNDSETGKFWTLYRAIGETVVNSLKNLKLEKEIDDISPKDGAHYIFWLQRNEVPTVKTTHYEIL